MRRFWVGLCTSVLCFALAAGVAYAQEVNPGVRIGEWIYRNVAALFAPLLAVMAIYYLAKRQFTQFLSFAAFAVLAALLIFAGGEFKDAAVAFGKWIIGK